MYENWDNHIPSDIMYLDCKKASDKVVPHESLLKKLQSAEVGDSLTAWVRYWLTGRINEYYSMDRLMIDFLSLEEHCKGQCWDPFFFFSIDINDL